jgi:hypothetical protein
MHRSSASSPRRTPTIRLHCIETAASCRREKLAQLLLQTSRQVLSGRPTSWDSNLRPGKHIIKYVQLLIEEQLRCDNSPRIKQMAGFPGKKSSSECLILNYSSLLRYFVKYIVVWCEHDFLPVKKVPSQNLKASLLTKNVCQSH